MKDLLTWLEGKKTHGTCAVILVLLIGQWAKLFTIPVEVYGVLVALALSFLRAGVSREIGDVAAGGDTAPTDEQLKTSVQRTVTGTGPMTGGPIAAALIGLVGLGLTWLTAEFVVGCAGPDAFFKAEKFAVDGAYGSLHTYNTWYRSATNAAANDPARCAMLTRRAESVWGDATNFYRTITLVDSLRANYELNRAQTNLTALQAGLGALSLQSTNLAQQIKQLISNEGH